MFDADRVVRVGLAAGCLVGVLVSGLWFRNESAVGALTAGFGLALQQTFRSRSGGDAPSDRA